MTDPASMDAREAAGAEDLIIARAAGGDLAAFEELYRRHVGRVYAICLRLTANVQQAEELTQDAFVRAWRGLGTFAGRSAFSSWLYRLAVNVVLDARRAHRRRWSREDSLEELDDDRAPTVDIPPTEGEIDLERAIAALPRGARIVYVLHEIEGYRHEEIAEATGVTTGTSKAQLHRARTLLRKALTR